ncbi:hypothetical protein [Phascolarctobacterium succinatutens]|uniref:hypothetical protein n=1 Tax=Phascolarctobacterium succinatutens TaxID=626940 RepID=UPI0026EAB9E7|nr:hypothetical protein [Phascolarctobacterium succinatutens]
MKKMLVKAVALSLVMGGVGFVANDAQASPWDDMQWQSKIEGSDARSKTHKISQDSKVMLLPIKQPSNKMQKISLITKLLL